MSGTYYTKVSEIKQLRDADPRLDHISKIYRFRVPAEYLDLVDWSNPADPIRKLVVPGAAETLPLSGLDATAEAVFTKVRGLQHKFPDTALILATANCDAYCRYCFRKRIFQPSSSEVPTSFSAALNYIRDQPEINNVILSGGDPLTMRHERLETLLLELAGIAHVKIIRIGSKSFAFAPGKILRNSALLALFTKVVKTGKSLYMMTHFDHPREVTREASEAVLAVRQAGAVCVNQCPLLRGVNSDIGTLGELFELVSFMGSPQYYVFQCRPTDGNSAFTLPLAEAFDIFDRESRVGSGLARTARFCVAHKSGKIQVVTRDGNRLLLRYLQAVDRNLDGLQFWQPSDSEEIDPSIL